MVLMALVQFEKRGGQTKAESVCTPPISSRVVRLCRTLRCFFPLPHVWAGRGFKKKEKCC